MDFISNLTIENFKSIRKLDNIKCKRINVFIGKPNVGKSNILEALSLVSLSNITYDFFKGKPENDISFAPEVFRCSNVSNVFHFFDTEKPILIKAQNFRAVFYKDTLKPGWYELHVSYLESLSQETRFDESWSYTTSGSSVDEKYYPIRYYLFKSLSTFPLYREKYLFPPYGANLYYLLYHNKELRSEIENTLGSYGQELEFFDDGLKKHIRIVTQLPGKAKTLFHYNTLADTIRRYIFHLAAIETNVDSVLLFEEPEAHSYPPYIAMLADKIIESKQNQFFITTHSPYMLVPFIEKCPYDEIAIFICSFENYETKIRELKENEIAELGTDINLFFNLNVFADDK